MRKTILKQALVAFGAGMLLVNSANAQLLRGLRDRVVDVVERRVEQNVENRVVQGIERTAGQAVDESFDALFSGAMGGGEGGDGGPSILSRMFDTSNLKVADEYRFDIAVTFEIQSFDSRGRASDQTEMVFHYSPDMPYTGTRIQTGEGADTGASMIIYDFDNQAMLMLMEAEGSRFSMAYNWAIDEADWNEAWDLDEEFDDSSMLQFERIGRRNISGYESEGYRTTDGEQVSEFWLSEAVAPGFERVFQANRTVPLLNQNMPAGYPQGMLMELNSENKSTGEKVQMRTKSIDMNAGLVFRMSDYPMMSFAALSGQQ